MISTSLSRPSFIQSQTDARWITQNASRTSRVLSRKPISSLGQHQSSLGPTASGLLSLGSRYTPSSSAAFGNSAVGAMGGATVVGLTSAQMSGQLSSAGGLVERDANYRLAAAIAGTSGRGRPRGRRPLRGQFPVVPIDMVRQLGIEQQVILQPAAPVAMRNKAVLCRPLSMSRKTQANVLLGEIEVQVDSDLVDDTSRDLESEITDDTHILVEEPLRQKKPVGTQAQKEGSAV
ncbi:unnamed protein product [Protopolystoma xenopodis]|uniref:Uncharacterized protein n=1 Tax=Protopolystoma xenopodis TaxID=117903 RepID=A0A3S5BE29_9PLAT|nr:unnamed protein product [Protopolystoma xenopodis]